jgi:hypothetical protein
VRCELEVKVKVEVEVEGEMEVEVELTAMFVEALESSADGNWGGGPMTSESTTRGG